MTNVTFLAGALYLVLSVAALVIGSDRKCGGLTPFLLSLILTPLVGLLIAFGSEHKSSVEYQKKVIEILSKIQK